MLSGRETMTLSIVLPFALISFMGVIAGLVVLAIHFSNRAKNFSNRVKMSKVLSLDSLKSKGDYENTRGIMLKHNEDLGSFFTNFCDNIGVYGNKDDIIHLNEFAKSTYLRLMDRNDEQQKQVIFIKGTAGCGKTFFCERLVLALSVVLKQKNRKLLVSHIAPSTLIGKKTSGLSDEKQLLLSPAIEHLRKKSNDKMKTVLWMDEINFIQIKDTLYQEGNTRALYDCILNEFGSNDEENKNILLLLTANTEIT